MQAFYLFLPKYQEFTGKVIQNHDQYGCDQLPQISVPVKDIYGNQENDGFCCTRGNTAADKFGQFGDNGLC